VSFGVLATLWAVSTGMHAIMKQLNITYGVKENRRRVAGR
jgi:membrane protein